jgi:hypothetical protein
VESVVAAQQRVLVGLAKERRRLVLVLRRAQHSQATEVRELQFAVATQWFVLAGSLAQKLVVPLGLEQTLGPGLRLAIVAGQAQAQRRVVAELAMPSSASRAGCSPSAVQCS